MQERTNVPACHPFPPGSREGRAGTRAPDCSNTSGALLFARIHPGILVLQNCPHVNMVFAGGGEMFCLFGKQGLQYQSLFEFPRFAA